LLVKLVVFVLFMCIFFDFYFIVINWVCFCVKW